MSSTVEDDSANALLIQVENFTNATSPSDEMGTYLRLGAVPSPIKAAYDAVNGGGSDGGAFTTASGEDLASKVLTFIDDTRDRGSGDFDVLTEEERQDESKRLHTKGGWRDHTDGNRVTTTRGDKVEVIGGNYKLLVLGREQWNDDAGVGLNHESSGGITYHFDEVPGQVVDIRRKHDGTTWSVVEECSTGHFVARYHGVDKAWHRGGDLKLRVGSRGAYKVNRLGSSWASVKDDHGFRADADFDKPDDASHAADFDWPGDDRLPNVREEVFAGKVTETTFAKTVEEINGTSDYRMDLLEEKIWTKKLYELNTFGIYEQRMVGALARETWRGTFLEAFVCGAAISLKVGLFWDFRVGYLTADFNIAALFGQLNLLGKRTQLDLSLLRINIDKASAWFHEFRIAPLHMETSTQRFKLQKVKKITSVVNYVD